MSVAVARVPEAMPLALPVSVALLARHGLWTASAAQFPSLPPLEATVWPQALLAAPPVSVALVVLPARSGLLSPANH
jgi:hypothetical protein